MTFTRRRQTARKRHAPILLITGLVLLVVSVAGAADRVVLGEYFTNLF